MRFVINFLSIIVLVIVLLGGVLFLFALAPKETVVVLGAFFLANAIRLVS